MDEFAEANQGMFVNERDMKRLETQKRKEQ